MFDVGVSFFWGISVLECRIEILVVQPPLVTGMVSRRRFFVIFPLKSLPKIVS